MDIDTHRRIDTARDILVGKVPDPKSQVEQITIALIYKFMDDMDAEAEELGGERTFFSGDFERYGWSKLMDVSLGGQEILNRYAEALEKMKENRNIPQLFRDIFKNAFLPYRDPETLRAFLKVIDGFAYDHSENLGDAFEYLLSIMSSQGDAGQFRTPRHIIDFMVELIDPQRNETILDPACGTAGFLISSFRHILNTNTADGRPGMALLPEERTHLMENITGYDISPDMVRISLVNLYLHGFQTPRINEYDTLTSEEKWNEFADVILANPPFMSPKGGIRPHKRFSIQSNRSEVLFVDYILEHLTTNGRAAVIVPEGIIFQSGNAYKALRKKLVEENYLAGVISLPAGIFQPYSGVKTSILWIDRELARRSENIVFAKVEHDGFDLGAQRKPNGNNDLPNINKSLQEYKESELSDQIGKMFPLNIVVKGKSILASEGSFSLNSTRYTTITNITPLTQVALIGDICEILDRKRKPITESERKNGPYPYYGATGIVDWVDDYLFDEKLVLIGEDGAKWGKGEKTAFVADGKYWVNNHAHVLRPNRQKIIDTLLVELVNNIDLTPYISGVTVPKLTQEKLREISIPLPPLEIQNEIVAEIEEYQKIIDGARMVIDNYHPRIDIDPSWPMVRLGDVCKTSSGGTPLRSKLENFENGTINWVKSGEVSNGFIYDSDEKITELAMKNSSVKLFPQNTVLVAMYGATAGKVGILKVESTTNQAICGIFPNDKINPEFLYYFLRGKTEEMVSQSTGGAQQNINQSVINDMKIPMPDLELQNEIVEKINDQKNIIDVGRNIIEIFSEKIKNKISNIWGKD